jgi:acid phosphatase (class A)
VGRGAGGDFSGERNELIARAERVAWGRVLGGIHFPSDTIGGRLMAEAVVGKMRSRASFRAAVEKCRAEAAPFLLKQAG